MSDSIKYFKQDLRHIFVNLPLSLIVILFYIRFGFSTYGFKHLITLICWSVYIYSLDDWLDGKRPFPVYNVPLIIISFLFYPVITISSLLGLLIINIQMIIHKKNFLLEKIESVGDVLVYIPIYFYPLNVQFPDFYLGTLPIIFVIDQVHKLGHYETSNRKLTLWFTIIISSFMGIQVILNHKGTIEFIILALIVILGAIRVIKSSSYKDGWKWFQVWQGYSIFLIMAYYIFFQWGTHFYFFEQ